MGPKASYTPVGTSFFLIALIYCLCSPSCAFALGSDWESQGREVTGSPAITLEDAQALINLLPAVKELRAKGTVVKWYVQTVATMNSKDYYFFWIYNAT